MSKTAWGTGIGAAWGVAGSATNLFFGLAETSDHAGLYPTAFKIALPHGYVSLKLADIWQQKYGGGPVALAIGVGLPLVIGVGCGYAVGRYCDKNPFTAKPRRWSDQRRQLPVGKRFQ